MARPLPQIGSRLEEKHPVEIVRAAMEEYGSDVAMSSSFQTQSMPLLHMVSRVAPDLPVIFLDTGYHFPATLEFRDQVVETLDLNLKVMRATMSREEFLRRHGDDLYARDPDLCCYINKVEPMERATEAMKAWISGIRRDQTGARASIDVVEGNEDGLIRIHPLATWTAEDVEAYREKHELPEHPLQAQGYVSVGCAPCTDPVEGEVSGRQRAGRWSGTEKTECGLHTELRDPDHNSGDGGSDSEL